MTIRSLPAAPAALSRPGVSSDISPKALERWNPAIQAAAQDDASISIFDQIGYDGWTGEGTTAKRIAAALRSMNGADVTVNINSPGGDVFEGLAIYNLLREYKGAVTVNVLGLAASAASFIAMAGDEVRIARAGFLMIHNSWVMAVGNRNDLREVAETLEPFDRAMADIYAARTGRNQDEMLALMDAETWIGGSDAIEAGFADDLLSADQVAESEGASASASNAIKRIDLLMARQNIPRSERRRLIHEIKSSTPSAAGNGTQNAADTGLTAQATADLLQAIARFQSAATTTQ